MSMSWCQVFLAESVETGDENKTACISYGNSYRMLRFVDIVREALLTLIRHTETLSIFGTCWSMNSMA